MYLYQGEMVVRIQSVFSDMTNLYLLFFFFFNVISQVKENPGPISGGLAPIYGAAGRMPDRVMVQDLLVNYMDGTC